MEENSILTVLVGKAICYCREVEWWKREDLRDIIGETEAMDLRCRDLSHQARNIIPEEEWEALKRKHGNTSAGR